MSRQSKQRNRMYDQEYLGLYPVVDSAVWVKNLLEVGVRFVQLRIKDPTDPNLENEIMMSIAYGRAYGAAVFINDYWQLAIKHRAYGVHLGQQDIATANSELIHLAGLQLGISTHSDEEVAIALSHSPDYIAYGPIFPTKSKDMPYTPRGLINLESVCECVNCPVIAIGGITLEVIPAVLEAGASGVAMISAITQATDPLSMARQMLQCIDEFNAHVH